MAQKGEEMTDTQVRLMERIERTTAELVRIRTLCSELEEATDNVVSEMFGKSEECDAHEQEIDMTKPQPCTKFAGATVEEWVAKLNEETYEVMRDAAHIELIADEADDEDKSSLATCLAIDLTDVIHVCVSWIAALGFNEEARGDLHRMVNEKNKARGHF